MSRPPLPNSDQSNVDLSLIEDISQSILSNLDRDGLVNSAITLLHQIFRFSRVSIYMARGDGQKSFRKIGISNDGLEPVSIFTPGLVEGPASQCITQRVPVVLQDTSHDSLYPPQLFEPFVKSMLEIPLLHADQLVGILELGAETTGVFEPAVVTSFQLLAGNLAIAIRNATLYRMEQSRRFISDRLRETIGTISLDHSVEEVCSRMLSELGDFLPFQAAALWLVKPSNEGEGLDQFTSTFWLAAARSAAGADEATLDQHLHDELAGSEIGKTYPWLMEIIHQGIPLIGSGKVNCEPLGIILGYAEDYSAIAAALLINGQAAGFLVCVHPQPDQYDAETVSLLQAFANSAVVAIENTRLFSAAHDQAWISTVVLQVAEATQSITSMDKLLETLVNIFPGLLGVQACSIFLWDPAYETFIANDSNGFDDLQSSRLKAWDIPPGSVTAFEQLKDTRSPVILGGDTIPDEVARMVFPGYDLDNDLLILFPLLTQAFLCGAILLDFSNSDLRLSSSQEEWDDKFALIQGAARQAASAIESLQLIKSQEEEAYISVALLQVAQAVVSLKHLDEILATIVRITPILVGVKRCIIYLWDARECVFRQSEFYGFSKSDLAGMGQVIKANEFPLVEAIQKLDCIIYASLGGDLSPGSWSEIQIDDYHVIEGTPPGSEEEQEIQLDESSFTSGQRLLIGFPLSVKAEILGVMLIEEEDPDKGLPSAHIREKRIEIVKGITQQAAIAIKNEQLQQEAVKSERMERELQLAREIQATFLPNELPHLQGWDIDARWQPARQVGGDFYDILAFDNHRIGVVIADVADKGMPAALFMTLIRTLIRAAANENPSPAGVLAQVNELLLPDAKQGMFVTVFYGMLDLESGTFCFANAGHNPPLVKRASDDELIELSRTSIALGLFPDIEVEEREIHLDAGDWVLLYTDGITEAFSSTEEMFGTERLVSLVSANGNTSSATLLDRIVDSVNEFIRGTDLSDDMTVLAIHRQPN